MFKVFQTMFAMKHTPCNSNGSYAL